MSEVERDLGGDLVLKVADEPLEGDLALGVGRCATQARDDLGDEVSVLLGTVFVGPLPARGGIDGREGLDIAVAEVEIVGVAERIGGGILPRRRIVATGVEQDDDLGDAGHLPIAIAAVLDHLTKAHHLQRGSLEQLDVVIDPGIGREEEGPVLPLDPVAREGEDDQPVRRHGLEDIRQLLEDIGCRWARHRLGRIGGQADDPVAIEPAILDERLLEENHIVGGPNQRRNLRMLVGVDPDEQGIALLATWPSGHLPAQLEVFLLGSHGGDRYQDWRYRQGHYQDPIDTLHRFPFGYRSPGTDWGGSHVSPRSVPVLQSANSLQRLASNAKNRGKTVHLFGEGTIFFKNAVRRGVRDRPDPFCDLWPVCWR